MSKQKKTNNWEDGIISVLDENGSAMFYHKIADKIIENNLVDTETQNPYITVNNYLQKLLEAGRVKQVERGIYIIAQNYSKYLESNQNPDTEGFEDEENTLEEKEAVNNPISAYGRFWSRRLFYENGCNLYGVYFQKTRTTSRQTSEPMDFTNRAGVYLLHKGYQVIYVGRASTKRLAERLEEHCGDQLRNRWDSFSWFSIDEISKDECLSIKPDDMLASLEALLIEVIGPDNNMRRGDKFSDKEYEQVTLAYLGEYHGKKNQREQEQCSMPPKAKVISSASSKEI